MGFSRYHMLFCLIWALAAVPCAADQPPEHLMAVCADCHGLHEGEPISVDAKCVECHGATMAMAQETAGVFHRGVEPSCSSCHGYHSTELLKAGDHSFQRSYGDPDVRNHCDACHRTDGGPNDISPGHVAAGDRYHVDAQELAGVGISEACGSCHDEMSLDASVPAGTPAFAIHGSHVVGVGVPTRTAFRPSTYRSVVDSRLDLYDGVMECTTCHRLTASTEWRLVAFESPTGMCRGCHDMSPGRPKPHKSTVKPFMVAQSEGRSGLPQGSQEP